MIYSCQVDSAHPDILFGRYLKYKSTFDLIKDPGGFLVQKWTVSVAAQRFDRHDEGALQYLWR
jgi:hypothetical protein